MFPDEEVGSVVYCVFPATEHMVIISNYILMPSWNIMTYTGEKMLSELERAEMVARWAHDGQTDMGGLPYWTHCHRVAGNLRAAGYDESLQAIGWLHDVVEDTHVTLGDLVQLGFSDRVIFGVASMTQLSNGQGQNEPNVEYWSRLKENPDAVIVKLYGDIPDNDDPLRRQRALGSGAMSPKLAEKLTEKYKRARVFLGAEFPSAPVTEWKEPHLFTGETVDQCHPS